MPTEFPPIEIKFFLCTGEIVKYDELSTHPDCHIVGHLCYIADEGKRVTAMAYWRESVSCGNVPPLKPTVDCLMIGDVRAIRCRYPGCERSQRWEIGKAAFLALMSRWAAPLLNRKVSQ